MSDPMVNAVLNHWQLSLFGLLTVGTFGWGYVGLRFAMIRRDPKPPWARIIVGVVGLVGFIDFVIRAIA
jgi:hypothetical protein